MQTVGASIFLSVDENDVTDVLTPTSIVEYGGVWELENLAKKNGYWLITAATYLPGKKSVVELRCERTPKGYSYELINGDMFKYLYTEWSISNKIDCDDLKNIPGPKHANIDDVCVTITSTYTFGGLFAPIWDHLATNKREKELKQALIDLAIDAGAVKTGEKE